MLSYLRFALLGLLLFVLVLVALANRDPVTIALVPQGLPFAPHLRTELPLFVVVFGGVLAGLVFGYLLEYVREYKHRRMASSKRREADRLAAELDRIRKERSGDEDDLLALIEDRGR